MKKLSNPATGHTRDSMKALLSDGHASVHGPDCRCTTENENIIVRGIFGIDCKGCWQSSDGSVTILVWPCRLHRHMFWESFAPWLIWIIGFTVLFSGLVVVSF